MDEGQAREGSPLRVLIVGLNYAPELVGIGPYTTGLAETLASAGHEIDVVAGRPYYPQWRAHHGYEQFAWRRSSERGVEIVRCPHYVPARPTGARRVLHHLSFATAALPVVVARALRRRPDVVLCIAPSIVSAAVARLGAALARAPLWLHVQDLEVDAAFATGLIRGGWLARLTLALERRLLRSCAMVSSISPQMIERLRAKGVPPERIYELRNWADPRVRPRDRVANAYRAAWSLGSRKVALYAGSLGTKQGSGLLIDAARILAARDDIVVVICGEGPGRAELAAAASGLRNVALHPLQPAERLGELLALADMHLLPQVPEAEDLVLPSKLANMLASGRPVIATAAPGSGIHEEIAECGIAVPPGDAAALASAIEQLADDPELAGRLGEAGARRAAARWSREAILAGFGGRLRALPGCASDAVL